MIATELPPPVSSPSSASRARRPPRFKPVLILALGIATLGAAVHFGTRARAADGSELPAPPPPPKVTVATVEERTLTDRHELLGRVEAIETVEVRARVSGHIDEVRLRAGELVKKGEVLFVIDQRPYRAQFDLARAAVERAKVRALTAERVSRRTEELLKGRAISVEEADVRTSAFAQAQAELLAAEAGLATARLDLEFTEVRSPIDGRVNRAYVTAGNLVSGAPGASTLLTSVVSVGDVYVYADVDEATLLAFNRLRHQGALATENGRIPVEMQLSDEAGFGRRGFIESADNRLQTGTGSLVLRMVFPNPEGDLIPGLSARVRLPVSAPQSTLLISERAIGTDQSQKFVLTVGADNIATYRAVKLGPLLEGRRIVRDGLHRGERVIVNGLQRSRPGARVNPETAAISTIAAK